LRNSSTVISSSPHSMETGQKDGAELHQVGGALTTAAVFAAPPTMYCSSPKKAKGMISRPTITVAIQPVVFSRSFCSMFGSGRAGVSRAVYLFTGRSGTLPVPARAAQGKTDARAGVAHH